MTKLSTGDPFFEPVFHPLIIACANGFVVSNDFPSLLYLLAIGSFRLKIRPKSELNTHVLMKYLFNNSIMLLFPRTPALNPFPLAQQASSVSGPSIETA